MPLMRRLLRTWQSEGPGPLFRRAAVIWRSEGAAGWQRRLSGTPLPVKVEAVAPGEDADFSRLQSFPGYTQEDLGLVQSAFAAAPSGQPGFVMDRLGVRTRLTSMPDHCAHLDGQVIGLPIPGDFHAETVEYVGLLKSVRSARGRFCAMELGAGWGPWMVSGAIAAARRGITDVRLLAVEADPDHFRFLRQHFVDNGLDPDRHTLLQAAVGAEAGTVRWPCPDPGADTRNEWGGRPIAVGASDSDYRGKVYDRFMDVEVVAINDLLKREPRWDLVHIDVQGAETGICAAGIGLLTERVRWLMVGTHSRLIDGQLIALMTEAGWVLENEKPAKFVFRAGAPTLEAMTTVDGTQVWRNPALVSG